MNKSTLVETRFEKYPEAVVLRMNRPNKRNALREVEMEHMADRLAALHHDAGTKVIIITGTADAFTSGQDVNDINAMDGPPLAALFERDIDVLSRIITMPKIVIAAVNGVSAGFGNHLAVCSDICVVKASAKFYFTGAAKAVPSPMLGTLLLPMAIGLKRAKGIYLRGAVYTPEQALSDGYCNAVVADAEWDAELEKLAAEFSSRDAQVMTFNKYVLNQGAIAMIGALKLSGFAAAHLLAGATAIPTGRVHKEK